MAHDHWSEFKTTKEEIAMNIDEIKLRVAKIESAKCDDEEAHRSEDELMEDFIRYISENGPRELSDMAKEVLKTGEIFFSRLCA